jgi:predicted outer membrane repeat protein
MRFPPIAVFLVLPTLLAANAIAAETAPGSFVLTLEDVTRGTRTIITDQIAPLPGVPGDSNTALDRILFMGKVGSFDVTIFANTYVPGPSGAPVQMNVSNFRVTSLSAGHLKVTLWRTDVASSLLGDSVVGVGTAGASLTARGAVTFKSWVDGGPPVFNPAINTISGGTLSRTSNPVRLNGDFDLLSVIDLTFDSPGTINANTDLQVRNAPDGGGHKLLVGDGTPASCTEQALLDALEAARVLGGGTIRFRCGPDPVTIALSPVTNDSVPLAVPDNTVIDGDGLITIDGGYRLIQIDSGISVRLTELAIGIVQIDNWGDLTIERSFFCCGWFSGILNYGTLTVKHSTFSNMGPFRTPIQNVGNATFNHTTFRQNWGTISNSGTLGVKNSSWFDNYIDGTGGIRNEGTLTVDNTEFSENGGIGAGALINSGSFAIKNSVFHHNFGNNDGPGVIRNKGSALSTIDNSHFSGNQNNGFRGGAIANNAGTLIIRRSSFTGNRAYYGGAISTEASLKLIDSTITGNTADFDGGGIYVDGITPTLIRTPVTGNTPDDIFIRP